MAWNVSMNQENGLNRTIHGHLGTIQFILADWRVVRNRGVGLTYITLLRMIFEEMLGRDLLGTGLTQPVGMIFRIHCYSHYMDDLKVGH